MKVNMASGQLSAHRVSIARGIWQHGYHRRNLAYRRHGESLASPLRKRLAHLARSMACPRISTSVAATAFSIKLLRAWRDKSSGISTHQ